MPPLVAYALSAAGIALVTRLLAREWRRVNGELDETRKAAVGRRERERLPKLRRDPRTGVYRP